MATNSFVDSFLHDLEISTPSKEAAKGRRPQSQPLRRIPPTNRVCKLNVDGAVARWLRQGVVGAVCRSHNGVFLGASAVVFEGVTHPGCLEAMACREGMALANDLNIGRC
jgi:hypothetical protein